MHQWGYSTRIRARRCTNGALRLMTVGEASLAVLRLVRPQGPESDGGERPRLVRLLAAIAPTW